ncbi:MAG: hypothetical protein LBP78_03340 [Acidaminococcales bacterium]|jgi:hypothetical protein|nr:hypothetical protein [Acidaminococcales bacterium]
MTDKEHLAALNDWPYLASLPRELAGFSLSAGPRENNGNIDIFSYENAALRKKLRCFYNRATRDYMLRYIFGLNEYNNSKYITPDLNLFTALLREGLTFAAAELAAFSRAKDYSSLKNKGIPAWAYQGALPDACCGFELYIRPDAPAPFINGSFIVADYSDFAGGHQFVLYYNELRDEFFAEKKRAGSVETTAFFDARTLKELDKKLREYLPGYLEDFRRQIIGLTATA